MSPFDKLFGIFKELITHTSGDFDEAIEWLRELDKEYELTDENYTIEDFIEDLKAKGYIREEIDENGGSGMGITAKTERAIRQTALVLLPLMKQVKTKLFLRETLCLLVIVAVQIYAKTQETSRLQEMSWPNKCIILCVKKCSHSRTMF